MRGLASDEREKLGADEFLQRRGFPSGMFSPSQTDVPLKEADHPIRSDAHWHGAR